VVVSAKDGTFLSAHTDFTVRLRELASGKELHRFKVFNLPRGLSISPDGRFAGCGSKRGLVYLFQLPQKDQ
jgi:hypothetical protein